MSWNFTNQSSISKKSQNLGMMLMGMFPQLQMKLGSFNLHYISGQSQTTTNSTAYRLRESEIFTDLMEPQLGYNGRRRWLIMYFISY